MVTRLIDQRPFQGNEEALQFFVLPLRYCVVAKLKTHAAHLQNAIRLTHESHRNALEDIARGAGISPKSPETGDVGI
jgi:hypothetical protein